MRSDTLNNFHHNCYDICNSIYIKTFIVQSKKGIINGITVTTDEYIQIIENSLPPVITCKEQIFLEDTAVKHIAKRTK